MEELEVFDWDNDGNILADDVLKTGTLNTVHGGGRRHSNKNIRRSSRSDKLKAYIEANPPRSVSKNYNLLLVEL